jgi:hypothetical protein
MHAWFKMYCLLCPPWIRLKAVPLHSHLMNGVSMSRHYFGLYPGASFGSLSLSILLRCGNYSSIAQSSICQIYIPIYIIHSFSYEAWPFHRNITANQNNGLGVAVSSQDPQFFLGSGMRRFCPEQINSDSIVTFYHLSKENEWLEKC